jgi:hypothetical protein
VVVASIFFLCTFRKLGSTVRQTNAASSRNPKLPSPYDKTNAANGQKRPAVRWHRIVGSLYSLERVSCLLPSPKQRHRDKAVNRLNHFRLLSTSHVLNPPTHFSSPHVFSLCPTHHHPPENWRHALAKPPQPLRIGKTN